MEAEKTTEQVRIEQEQKFKATLSDYLKTFTSAHGRRVLKDMRRKYCGHIWNDNPEVRACNAAKHDVVKDIEAILILGGDSKRVEELFRQPEDVGFEF